MRRNYFMLVLASLLAFSSPSFARPDYAVEPVEPAKAVENDEFAPSNEVNCSAVDALRASYGNIMATNEGNNEVKLTFSAPNTEINSLLTLTVGCGWYPKHLEICGVAEDKVAILMIVTTEENDAFRHFKVLQKLTAPGVLPWKKGKLEPKQAYVTSIETDFGNNFIIRGETIKSGLIFTTLTPKISKIGADLENLDADRFSSRKKFDRKRMFTRETYEDNDTGINGQPFFERGTYKEDAEIGRYMEFTLRCQW